MPTKPLPAGTGNTSINAPTEWLTLAHRAANDHGLSLGEFVKQCIESTVQRHSPHTAQQLRQARTVVRVVLTALLAFSAWKISQQLGEVRPPAPEFVDRVESIWMFRGGAR